MHVGSRNDQIFVAPALLPVLASPGGTFWYAQSPLRLRSAENRLQAPFRNAGTAAAGSPTRALARWGGGALGCARRTLGHDLAETRTERRRGRLRSRSTGDFHSS